MGVKLVTDLQIVGCKLYKNAFFWLDSTRTCWGDYSAPPGPLAIIHRTAWVSRYQKGETNLDFTEARDSEWQWHQLSHMQVCI